MTNVEKLQAVNILPTPHKLSLADEAAVNNLADDEVKALVHIKETLGHDFIKRNTSLIL